jgi:site-specific DNA-methyltransferase (cytosine-N4-specific)
MDKERATDFVQAPLLVFETARQSVLYHGDALSVLRQLPAASCRTAITSPPYWGLRDYQAPGQLGNEENVDDYVERLVEVFAEVRRVLTDDGSFWLNVGDCYTSGDRAWRAPDKKNPARAMGYRAPTPAGLKPKDLVGVPWRLAFALQADGWYLRSEIIWHKPNAMPESVKDRPTRVHEQIFLLTKSEDYDYESARELGNGGTRRNRRTVWSVDTQPFKEAHFATYPPALVEPCVLAGSRPGDTVLDPFFGSGTTGLVAAMQDRYFVGIEIKPEYVEIASRRLTERLVNFNVVKTSQD